MAISLGHQVAISLGHQVAILLGHQLAIFRGHQLAIIPRFGDDSLPLRLIILKKPDHLGRRLALTF